MIAGFHGNADPLMIFFLLAAILSAERGWSPWLTGLCFGLALNVKILPVFLLPAFWFTLSGWRERWPWATAIAVTSLVWWLPYLMQDPALVLKATFSYNSLPGIWGAGYLLRGTGLFIIYSLYAKYGILLLAAILAWWTNRDSQQLSLFELCGMTLFLFLFLTPGFGVQYLYWLIPWAAVLGWRTHLLHWLAAGAFLLAVYTFWSGGLPWGFADSPRRGIWHGATQGLQLLAWASTAHVLIAYHQRFGRIPAPSAIGS